MARTINKLIEREWPPVGRIRGICIKAESGNSKNKKTPQITLFWESQDCEYAWTDYVFLTKKALSRVALVASHVCGFDGTISDDDAEALAELSDYIINNAKGKVADCEIVEQKEIFIPESGPDMGRKLEKTKKRVAFNGYYMVDIPTIAEKKQAEKPDNDNLPF